MNGGRIEQLGSPQDVYDRPVSEFVARLLGGSNLLRGKARDAKHQEVAGGVGAALRAGAPGAISIRQHEIGLEAAGAAATGGSNVLLAGVVVAFLQAMTLFGSPTILALPAGFHTMTTKIWSLFQYPPKPELVAAASLPLLVLTIVLLRAQSAVLGRRGFAVVGAKNSAPRPVPFGALDGDRPLQRPALPAGVPALRRAGQCRVLAHPVAAAELVDADPAIPDARLAAPPSDGPERRRSPETGCVAREI